MIYFAKAIVCGTIIKQSCCVPENNGDLLNTALSMCEKTSIFYRGDLQLCISLSVTLVRNYANYHIELLLIRG